MVSNCYSYKQDYIYRPTTPKELEHNKKLANMVKDGEKQYNIRKSFKITNKEVKRIVISLHSTIQKIENKYDIKESAIRKKILLFSCIFNHKYPGEFNINGDLLNDPLNTLELLVNNSCTYSFYVESEKSLMHDAYYFTCVFNCF